MVVLEPSVIPSNLEGVRSRLASAAREAGRDAASVRLVAVSKTYSREEVAIALRCGQLAFGENRVQEALLKFPDLRAQFPTLRLHLIGTLQTNKARDAVRHVDVIATLDRQRLAEAIDSAAQIEGKLPDLLIQVNVGGEVHKGGVSLAEADGFIDSCHARFGDKLTGLMCIPPVDEDPAPHFSWLVRCAARHALMDISMGMSGDFETAIHHGSTEVRIGTAIFGGRG